MNQIHISGVPVPQPRPRFGKGRAYSTIENGVVAWKRMVEWHANKAGWCGLFPIGAPVAVDLDFALKSGPTSKPDLDNLAKPVLDALTAAGVWPDDSCVVALSAKKRRATDGALGVTISVRVLDQRV